MSLTITGSCINHLSSPCPGFPSGKMGMWMQPTSLRCVGVCGYVFYSEKQNCARKMKSNILITIYFQPRNLSRKREDKWVNNPESVEGNARIHHTLIGRKLSSIFSCSFPRYAKHLKHFGHSSFRVPETLFRVSHRLMGEKCKKLDT